MGNETRTRPLDILADPRAPMSAEAVRSQQGFLAAAYRRLDEVHASARQLRQARGQVEALLANTKDRAASDSLGGAGKALMARIDSVVGSLVNVRNKTFQDVVNFPPGIDAQYVELINVVEGSAEPVTGGVTSRSADLDARWAALQRVVESILGAQLQGFNALVRAKGVPAIVVPD
jgi:hypothetical protein